MSIEAKIAKWIWNLRRQGLEEGQDQFDICVAALIHLGRPYGQFEDLNAEFIDCSTLTSQAHWTGAQIGIPFIADSQRVARSGQAISDMAQVRPGDVVARYAASELSPDGMHNHVGIYLGSDEHGEEFVIEAKGDSGVIITAFRDFPPEGGIRRFWGRRRASKTGALAARQLADMVPKLGRLGARQYRSDGSRQVHDGLDIYRPAKSIVRAPLAGAISASGTSELLIQGKRWSARLLGVTGVVTRAEVSQGEVIALVNAEPHDPDLVHSEPLGVTHVEVRLEPRAQQTDLGIGMQPKMNYLRQVRFGALAAIA